MITKTVHRKKRKSKSWMSRYHDDKHTDLLMVETWYFLFIPVYIKQTLIESNI